MKLVLCKLSLVVVMEHDGSTVGEMGETAKWFANEEIRNGIECDSIESVNSVEELPPDWRDSLPYLCKNTGAQLTCRQILERKP